MNYGIILYILGVVLKFEAAFMLLPALCGAIYRESSGLIFLLCAAVSFLCGTLFSLKKPKKKQLFIREGFVSVAFSWIVMGIFGALPFVLTKEIPNYVDALFEIISGFTTTGASIMPDVEILSHASQFWRCFSHWIGGMGVFVLIMSVIPLMGGSTMNLMKAESPGPSVDKLVPHIKDTAKLLYAIYIVISVAEIIMLLIFGMPLYDALCTTFATVGTGGFGIKGDSFTSYNHALQNIVTIFMILSGINYSAYFLILQKKFKGALALEEVRWYLTIIGVSVLVIWLNSIHLFNSFFEAMRVIFFQVASIITTTGFSTADFDLWPSLSKTILVCLMFVGACAGSTGGGIKVSRILILFKSIKKELSLYVHPREVRVIRMDRQPINDHIVRQTLVFMAAYTLIFFASMLVISFENHDFTTNFTAVAATLNNIGPGLCAVGPTCNFSFFTPFSKLILILDMLIGRLELFPILVLFMPANWRK